MENGDLNTPRDLDAELIKLVKENPDVYKDTNNIRKQSLRDEKWAAISKTLGLSVEMTMKKYRNLRNNLTRNLAKPKVKSVSDLSGKNKELEFLIPHMKDKQGQVYLRDITTSANNSPNTTAQDVEETEKKETVTPSNTGKIVFSILL